MRSNSLQELVKSIFGSEVIKSEFLKNPEAVIARFKLTDEEKKSVLNVHSRMGLVSSNSGHLEATIRPAMDWFAPTP